LYQLIRPFDDKLDGDHGERKASVGSSGSIVS
jgi:hypothetical protein